MQEIYPPILPNVYRIVKEAQEPAELKPVKTEPGTKRKDGERFEEIIMIDPRYYYDNADDLVRQEGVTDVLFLYNADTFGADTSLYAVLG